jgi:hypothetical protein
MVLRPETSFTLISMSNIAGILDSQGKYEEMHSQALEPRRKGVRAWSPVHNGEHEQLRSNARTSGQVEHC